ncbi:hypothetical protein DDE18_19025 [Nocardioides gansuensis]|uniref:J domain-containing protein n=1 Tax=Nocardioides gansuensis TaxID=2138300 RepID=A0A2T8F6A4_9ACTN|nr:DnaJ domain-containing protein [Nocardioides gansuensis]PVG81240.1 hypothetical protein DDE18_19025 [Nocardioides gansuensis]
MTPSWYDVLDVDRDASADEIRAAWRAAIADLEPGSRRFRTLNQAAEVLLDPQQRAAYDAQLDAEGEGLDSARPAEGEGLDSARPAEGEGLDSARLAEAARPAEGEEGQPGVRRTVPAWLLIGLGVLALAMAGVAAWTGTITSTTAEEATREAQAAAERAVVPILSYDHETLEADKQRAHTYLTPDYRAEFDRFFAVIEENAPETQTRVTGEVLASAVVLAGEDRAQILVFVDRPTTNKVNPTPVVYRDQVTLTMERVGDDWLVDQMRTTPPPE